MESVYPEVGIPGERRSSVKYNHVDSVAHRLGFGPVSVAELSICLHVTKEKRSMLYAGACLDSFRSTNWIYNDKGFVLFFHEFIQVAVIYNKVIIKYNKIIYNKGMIF